MSNHRPPPPLPPQRRTLNQTIDILHYVDSSGTTAKGPLGGDQVDRALVSELVGALHGWDGNLFAGANIKPSERRGMPLHSTGEGGCADPGPACCRMCGERHEMNRTVCPPLPSPFSMSQIYFSHRYISRAPRFVPT